jgi:nicotinamide-nucleotide amidase
MRTSLVLIGDELLNGSVADTAAAWLGGKLFKNGFELAHVQLVGDELAAISDAITVAVSHGDAVVLTGGLGPTSDDLTRNALARSLRVPLLRNQNLVGLITKRYLALGRAMPENAASMADLPEGSTSLLNQEGSAPGIRAVLDGVPIFALPGVPREMRAMFAQEVLPELLREFESEIRTTYILRVAIEGESAIAMKLRDWERDLPSSLSVAYLAELGNVLVKVTGTRESEVHQYAQRAALLIGDSVYALQDRRDPPLSLEAQVHRLLDERGQTIATAESLTGGGVGVALTEVPGSSENYVGGFVAYSPALKTSLLGVSAALITEVGTVDPRVAYAMAIGAREATGADWAVASTGVAGPGQSEDKVPGTVYLALVGPPAGSLDALTVRVIRLEISNLDRVLVRRASVIHALELVRRTLSGLGSATGVEDVTYLCGHGRESCGREF